MELVLLLLEEEEERDKRGDSERLKERSVLLLLREGRGKGDEGEDGVSLLLLLM